MLKLVESRLNQEKETILSQQQSQTVLLSNLQTIQVHVVLMLWTSVNAAQYLKAQFYPFIPCRLLLRGQRLTRASVSLVSWRSRNERSLSCKRGWNTRWSSATYSSEIKM